MADDAVADEPIEQETGTPPEDTPAETDAVLETPSGDETNDDDEPANPTPDEPAPPDDDDPNAEDAAWENFNKKFAHIKDDRQRRAAMGRQYWEKASYARQVAKENERLKADLEKRTKDETPPKDAPKPEQLVKLDARIQDLYKQDQTLQGQYTEKLKELREADRAIDKLEGKLEDVGDDYPERKESLERRIELAKLKKDGIVRDWNAVNSERGRVNEAMERALADRDWTEKYLQEQDRRSQSAKADQEKFDKEFPEYVAGLVQGAATDAKLPNDPKIRAAVVRYVNRSMVAELNQLGERKIGEVDIPAMVRGHVKEFLEDHALAARLKFQHQSDGKLRTTSRPANSTGKPAVPAPKPAVPPSQLNAVSSTPAMARAREYLRARGL